MENYCTIFGDRQSLRILIFPWNIRRMSGGRTSSIAPSASGPSPAEARNNCAELRGAIVLGARPRSGRLTLLPFPAHPHSQPPAATCSGPAARAAVLSRCVSPPSPLADRRVLRAHSCTRPVYSAGRHLWPAGAPLVLALALSMAHVSLHSPYRSVSASTALRHPRLHVPGLVAPASYRAFQLASCIVHPQLQHITSRACAVSV